MQRELWKKGPRTTHFYCMYFETFLYSRKDLRGILNFTYIFVWSGSRASLSPRSYSHLASFTVKVRLPSSLLPDPWSPLTLLPPTILLSGLSPPSTNTTKCKATDTKKKADCYIFPSLLKIYFLTKTWGWKGEKLNSREEFRWIYWNRSGWTEFIKREIFL